MLREEVEQYTKLTGEDGWHVPIIKVGAYLDGYNKGLEVLYKIRDEIADAIDCKEPVCKAQDNFNGGLQVALQIIDKYRKEQE